MLALVISAFAAVEIFAQRIQAEKTPSTTNSITIAERSVLPDAINKAAQVAAEKEFATVAGTEECSESAWVSTALSEMLNTELGSDHKLLVVPEETVNRTKRDLSLAESDSLSQQTLAGIHRRLGADFVVLGSHFDLGPRTKESIRLDFRLQNTSTGETLEWASIVGREQEIPELAIRVGLLLRTELGTSSLRRNRLGKRDKGLEKEIS